MDTIKIHPFEKAGLGAAPFKCVAAYEKRGPIKSYDAKSGVTLEIGYAGQPMGTCDYCGTGIALCFEIKSADGKRFIVGSDCVAKTHREATHGLTDADRKLALTVKRETKRLKDTATDGRVEKAFGNLWANYDLILEKLGGRTVDYILFCHRFAGRSGKTKVARMIEKALSA